MSKTPKYDALIKAQAYTRGRYSMWFHQPSSEYAPHVGAKQRRKAARA